MRHNNSLRRLDFICGLLCLFVALYEGCAKREPTAGVPPQVLRVSQRNEPSDLDPATATLPDEFFIIRALSEGLLVPDTADAHHGEPQPAAAERFEVSADGLSYTFHLRPAALWSDGSPVTAHDFVASYRRILTPGTAAAKGHLFYPVKNAQAYLKGTIADFSAVGFAATDAHTLVVTLGQPTPRFPHYVASGPWIPVKTTAVAQHGRTWTQPGHFVGNGPFLLSEWRQQQRIVVRKNPRYHDADAVHIDEIQFIRLDSGDTEERTFRAGQVDVTMALPSTKIEPYQRDHPAELHRAPLAETRFLAFNTRRPPLDDPRVRQALSLAVDRPRLVERVLRGGQVPSTGFVPVPFDAPLRRAPSTGTPRFEPNEARRLLAEAGFGGGKGFPHFEVTAWSSSQIPVLEALQSMWRDHLGIEVTLATREAKVHLASLAAGTYDIAFATTLIDVPDATAVLADFVTGAPGNSPHWSDPDYDARLIRLLAMPEPAARAKLQAEAEEHLLRAAVVAPLYTNSHLWLMSERVRDWREDNLWVRDYTGVNLSGP